MQLETERLIITEFTRDMANDVHRNSLDEDNRRFVPDEVFETPEEARETIEFIRSRYGSAEGPWIFAVITKDTGQNIGYVQLVPMDGKAFVLFLVLSAIGCAVVLVSAALLRNKQTQNAAEGK